MNKAEKKVLQLSLFCYFLGLVLIIFGIIQVEEIGSFISGYGEKTTYVIQEKTIKALHFGFFTLGGSLIIISLAAIISLVYRWIINRNE